MRASPDPTPVPDPDGRCPVERTLDLVGDRWTALVVWRLMQGPMRHTELRRTLPGISPKTLTERLRRLEAEGVLSRTVHAEVPPRVVYEITEHGRSLDAIFAAMAAWGARAPQEELVVLLDEDLQPCGTAPKATVHTRDTPLHLAFSCWLLDGDGRVLLTRRAASKRTWPGVWTNAVCGHPSPGEDVAAACLRRVEQELGVVPADVRLVLPDFRYRAVMDDGTVEHEVCPVFAGALPAGVELRPDPAEVGEARWLAPAELDALLADRPDAWSPWMRLQRPQLDGLLGRPSGA